MKREKNNGKVYRRVLIAFLVIVLLLTFFSKSIYNYRLPVVTTAVPKQGELDFQVESTGEVSYAALSSCYAEEDGIIQEIFVGVGDIVKKGQRLMQMKVPGTDKTEEIIAPEDGIIASIGTEKGKYVSYMANEALYMLAEKSGEWSVLLQLTEEEAEKVERGSKAMVNLSGGNTLLEGNVAEISAYENETFSGYQVDVRFRHEDFSIVGQKADIRIKKDNKLYDTLVPVSSLRKDTKGYYVLVLQADDSILGTGYKARRNSVDLLDSDESYCAVEGVPEDAVVIVAATKEIAAGDHVYYEAGEEQDEDEE